MQNGIYIFWEKIYDQSSVFNEYFWAKLALNCPDEQ